MLEALGNIGDFLGGLGVVITLPCLVAQIRENTRASKSASYQAGATASSNAHSSPAFWRGRSVAPNTFTIDCDRRDRSRPLDWLGASNSLVVGQPRATEWWTENSETFSKDFQLMVDGLEPMGPM